MIWFNRQSKLSKIVYLVGLITLLTRIGYFMSLPFLAVYLSQDRVFTAGEIGVVIGVSGFLYSITSLFSGVYVEQYAKKNVLIITLFLSGLCFLTISYSLRFFWILLLLNAALGWFRALGDVSAITLMVKKSENSNLRQGYSLRYLAMNIGAMIGPLIGAIFAGQKSLAIFIVAGIIYMVLSLMLFFIKFEENTLAISDKKFIFKNVRELCKEKFLLNITFINLLIWTLYSQLESTVPQYMTQSISHPAILLSIMMMLNAVMCVILSPFTLRLGEKISIKKMGVFGSIFLMMGFLLIAIFPRALTFLVAILLISIGELFTMTLNGLYVARISPKNLIATYNGFFNFSTIGLSIGPVLGGYALQFFGSRFTFILISLISTVCIWRYLSFKHPTENTPSSLQNTYESALI